VFPDGEEHAVLNLPRRLPQNFLKVNHLAMTLLATATSSYSRAAVPTFSWCPAMMLALEASNVIDLRWWKIARGGHDAATESHLMVKERLMLCLKPARCRPMAAIRQRSLIFTASTSRQTLRASDERRQQLAETTLRFLPNKQVGTIFVLTTLKNFMDRDLRCHGENGHSGNTRPSKNGKSGLTVRSGGCWAR
jgi:hypothetical protein